MISAIILAGGLGRRMQSSLPKQLLPLKGKLVLQHSVELFCKAPFIDEVVVVLAKEYLSHCAYDNVLFAEPGLRRQDSLQNGFSALSPSCRYVLIHDAARPLVKLADIERLIAEGQKAKAATLAVPLKATIKEKDKEGFVTQTLSREQIWEIQTPQFLEYSLLKKGLTKAIQKNLAVTDDVSLAEHLGHKVKLVEGSYSNIKLTTQEDLPLLEALYED